MSEVDMYNKIVQKEDKTDWLKDEVHCLYEEKKELANKIKINEKSRRKMQKSLMKEIERLNNIINQARRMLGEHKHYSTPTEEQNTENEKIVNDVYFLLHNNLISK